MAEAQHTLFGPEYNRSTTVQISDRRIPSPAGVFSLRKLDHELFVKSLELVSGDATIIDAEAAPSAKW